MMTNDDQMTLTEAMQQKNTRHPVMMSLTEAMVIMKLLERSGRRSIPTMKAMVTKGTMTENEMAEELLRLKFAQSTINRLVMELYGHVLNEDPGAAGRQDEDSDAAVRAVVGGARG